MKEFTFFLCMLDVGMNAASLVENLDWIMTHVKVAHVVKMIQYKNSIYNKYPIFFMEQKMSLW